MNSPADGGYRRAHPSMNAYHAVDKLHATACNRPIGMGRQTAKTMEFIGFVKSETCVFTEKSTQFGRGITILRLRKP